MFFSPLVFASNVPRPHEMLGETAGRDKEAQTEISLCIPEEKRTGCSVCKRDKRKRPKIRNIPGCFSLRLTNTTPSSQKSHILTQWLSFCDKGISGPTLIRHWLICLKLNSALLQIGTRQSHRGAHCCRGVWSPLFPPVTLLVRAHSYRGYWQLPNTCANTPSAEWRSRNESISPLERWRSWLLSSSNETSKHFRWEEASKCRLV